MNTHDHDLSSLLPRCSPATREAHPAVREALGALLHVLATSEAAEVTIRLLDDVADVVSDLIDSHPPMPPLSYPAHGAHDGDHACRLLDEAITDLLRAAQVSKDGGERLRAVIAARQLGEIASRSRP